MNLVSTAISTLVQLFDFLYFKNYICPFNFIFLAIFKNLVVFQVILPVRDNHFWIVVVANFARLRFETYCPYYDATVAENIAMTVIDNFK